MDSPLVVLDTETATVRGAPHLVELGAVRVVEGEITEHFESLVRPQVPIEEEAADCHGLDEDSVRDAPSAPEVLAEFLAWLGPETWTVAHDARADAHVVSFELARAGLEPPAAPMLDTLRLSRRLIADSPDHKLATLVDHLALELDSGAHRALPDAVACAQVLDVCVSRMGGWDETEAGELLRIGRSPVTLATASPLAPRNARRTRSLIEAAREEREVVLTYGAPNSGTPARLAVLPRFLYRNDRQDYLEAECVQSGQLKTYRLDRLHRVEVH